MLVWSLLAWLFYSFTDPVLAWLATSLELVVNQGQDAARTLGGAPAGDVLAALDTSRWAGQLLGMVKGAGKAAVVVVWLVGLCPSSKHLAQVWRGVNGERASSGVGF